MPQSGIRHLQRCLPVQPGEPIKRVNSIKLGNQVLQVISV